MSAPREFRVVSNGLYWRVQSRWRFFVLGLRGSGFWRMEVRNRFAFPDEYNSFASAQEEADRLWKLDCARCAGWKVITRHER